jgi:hypothetical protein
MWSIILPFHVNDCVLLLILNGHIFAPKIFGKIIALSPGGVAQWTSHPPQEQEGPGSNPARV